MKNTLVFVFIAVLSAELALAKTAAKSPKKPATPVATEEASPNAEATVSIGSDKDKSTEEKKDSKGNNAKKFTNQNPANAAMVNVHHDDENAHPFSGFASLSASTNLYDYKDGTRRDGADVFVSFSARLNRNYSLNGRVIYGMDLKDSQNNDFSDTTFTLGRAPIDVWEKMKMTWSFGLVAPTSKTSRIITNLYTQARGAVTFIPDDSYFWANCGMTVGLGLNRNFHQYETNSLGGVSNAWGTSQVISFRYGPSPAWTLSMNVSHVSNISYQNGVREAFEATQDISYSFDRYSLSVGHSNSGSTLAANGVDSNVRLIDENNSTVYLALTGGF